MFEFNFYQSLPFWGFFIIIAFVCRIVQEHQKLRKIMLLVSSILMIMALPQIEIMDLAIIVGVSSCIFVIGYSINKNSRSNILSNRMIAVMGIVIILVFLLLFKYKFVQVIIFNYIGLHYWKASGMISLLGVSYFSFKMIHYLVECYKDRIEEKRFLTFLNYILFFPAFTSGPINRYNHFAKQIDRPANRDIRGGLKNGSVRVVHGLFKKIVLAQLLLPHILGSQADVIRAMSGGQLLLGLYAYALYFYFDFSGYSDLAIGSAQIMGFELPENFNNPFIKKNIRELWTSWHISLTSWLVDYIYWPIVRKLRALEYFREHPIVLSNTGMIITFLICGMWHGESANFIWWGAYHGIGISIATIYQREKRKIKSELIQKYFRSKASHWAGVFLTFNFFSIGLALFVLDMEKIEQLIRHLLTS